MNFPALNRELQLAAVLGVFAVMSVSGEDAGTNTPPARTASTPAKLDEAFFRIVSERNIFNANRSGGTVRSTNTRRPARVETVALVGTMAYEKGAFAFFEGSSSEFTKALKPNGVIAGYKLVDILANGVKLEMDGHVTELAIGTGLRREDQGAWKVTEMVATEAGNAGGSSESNGRSTRNDRSRRGDDSERNGGRSSETAGATTSSAPASSAEQSEILKRLMERREKESQ